MFHSFLSDNSKQYAPTTAAYIKQIIELLEKEFLGSGVSNKLENKDGCA